MKLVLGVALAAICLASCMAQFQVGDQSVALGEDGGQSVDRPRVRNQAEELGRVAWGRDLDAAKAKSAETGKPILLLFQEVPG